MSKLIDEAPLLVLPTLAECVGLNEAILLQQFHFWQGVYGQRRNGRIWIWKTEKKLIVDFPWWSGPTIRRIIENCETRKLLHSTDLWNANGGDRTKWYSVDAETINALTSKKQLIKMISRSDQSDQLSLEESDHENVVDELTQQHLSFLSYTHAHARMSYLIEHCDLLTTVPVARLMPLVERFGIDRTAEAARWYCLARDSGKAHSGGWLSKCLAEDWPKPGSFQDHMYLSEEENLKRYSSGVWDEIEQ